MAQAVILPKLGQQTEESTIIKWHKKVGDKVQKGDVLFEMETDKAVLEAESFFEGTLLRILVPENQTVPVNTVVAFIGEEGETVPDTPPPVAVSAPSTNIGPGRTAPCPSPSPVLSGATAAVAPPTAPVEAVLPRPTRHRVSPRARALARQWGIDPSLVPGSGPGGRVITRDVEAWLERTGYRQLHVTPAARQVAQREQVNLLEVRGSGTRGRIVLEDVQRFLATRPRRMSKMRQVIAQRLTHSFTTTPHFYVTVSADMTDLLAYRQELKAQGLAFKVTDFVLKAVVMTLQEFPILNSVVEGAMVRWRDHIDLGLAVGLDDGLVVPVIRSAEALSLRELSKTAAELAEKARAGKLLPNEMTGSSFTVSNMGMLDVENFAAIINPGEAAILAVASTRPTPVVRDDEIVIRSIMKMTLSGDHRIVDGTTGARFVNAVRAKLEDGELWKRLI